MKQQHTPGPWKVDGTYIYEVGQDKIIAEVETYNNGELPYEANARLMAAAPELFEKLEELYNAVFVMEQPRLYKALAEAKKLIEKIEGDESNN